MSQNNEKSFEELMNELDGMFGDSDEQPVPQPTQVAQPVQTQVVEPTPQPQEMVVAQPTETTSITTQLSALPTSAEDIRKELNANMLSLVQSQQVRAVAYQVDLENAITTVPAIGGNVMNEIDQVSSAMIQNIEKVPLENGDKLIKNLERIMDKVDIEQVFKDAQQIEKPNLLSKISSKLSKAGVEGILSKYNTLTSAFEVIEGEYARIILELQQSTKTLMQQLQSAKKYHDDLDTYIAVMYILKERVALEIIPELQRQLMATGDRMIEQDINHYFMALQLIDQRLLDLQVNQQTVLQTVPMIRNSIMTNHQLGMGFRTALDSVPLLKSNIVTAMEMKRSIIAGHTLDKAQQLRNKQLANMGQASLKQAELATKSLNSSAVTIETLQKVSDDVNNAQKQLTQGIRESFNARDVARDKLLDMKSKMIADSRQSSQELLDIATSQRLQIK